MSTNIDKSKMLINTLNTLYGNKKIEVLKHLIANCDKDLIFRGTYEDIMRAVDVSKPTIVGLFRSLRKSHLLYKEKNGMYRFNQKLTQ